MSDRSPDTRFLARLFSVETVLVAITAAFAFGVAYNALASSDERNAAAIRGVEQNVLALSGKQTEISDDVQDIKVDVATIKTNQENQAEQVQQLRQGVNEILRELRQR